MTVQESFRIVGEDFPRVCYGSEKDNWGADRQLCHDCGVTKGEIHIFGCDVERCPRCDGQVIYCECEFDDEPINEPRAKPKI